MRMDGNVRREGICDAVRDCDPVQHSTQLQVAKEHIMGKHKHAVSLSAKLDSLTEIWHSKVTEAELGALFGLLDPVHQNTWHAV